MNVILENMRANGTNLAKWSRENGFNYVYAHQVAHEKDGNRKRSGKAKEIVSALNRDGYMVAPPAEKPLIWPSDLIINQK